MLAGALNQIKLWRYTSRNPVGDRDVPRVVILGGTYSQTNQSSLFRGQLEFFSNSGEKMTLNKRSFYWEYFNLLVIQIELISIGKDMGGQIGHRHRCACF